MVATTPDFKVRPVQWSDVDAIIALLRQQEMASGLTSEHLRRLFEYRWDAPKRDLGCVVADGDRIAGFLGAIYAERMVRGQVTPFCNLSTWYVSPECRGYGVLLLKRLMSPPGLAVTTFTPNATAMRVYQGLGFRILNQQRLVFPPGVNPTALHSRRGRILDHPDEIRPLLNPTEQRILTDHLPYGCRHYLVVEGSRYSFIVTKRRGIKRSVLLGNWPVARIRGGWFPASDIFHISDPELAFRHWETLKWRIMRRERVVAVMALEWLLGPKAPRGIRVPHPALVFRGPEDPRDFDLLYSEMVLLPI